MLIDFHPWHLDLMKTSTNTQLAIREYEAHKTLEKLIPSNLVGTIVTPGPTIILGIMGAVPLSLHECEVFVLAAEDRKEHPLEFAKTIKRALIGLKEEFRRVQTIGEDTNFYRRWFEWLGFVCEGPVREGETKLLWGLP